MAEPAPSPGAPIPGDLAARWDSSLERVFATGPSQPEHYQRATGAVGILVQKVRERATGCEELLELWQDRMTLVEEVSGLLPAGADTTLCLEAAFAMHHPVAREADASRRRAESLRSSGDAWVTLDESGDFDGSPFIPYRRLTARATSGTAIMVATEPDERLVDTIHRVEVFDIDPRTGRIGAAHEGEAVTFASAEAREEHVHSLQAGTTPDP